MVPNTYETCASILDEWKPEFVAYSLYTGYHKPLLELNRRLKESLDFISVLGGPHDTFFPEIIYQEGVDLVCRGETLDQSFDTMKINIKMKTDYTWISIFQPYPRTKLAEYAVENNYFGGDYDNLPANWYRKSALINPQRKELERSRPLISLGVEFPWLTWLIRGLVKLPLYEVYNLVWKIHRVYCYRYRVMPVKFTLKEIIKLSWNYPRQRTA